MARVAGCRRAETSSAEPRSRFDDGGEEGGEAVPRDLDTDAEQNEGDDAEDSVGRGGRDPLCDFGGVGVAEVTEDAESNDGKKYADVGQNVVGKILIRDVRGDCEQCNEGARPRGDGKGERIEDARLEMAVSGSPL